MAEQQAGVGLWGQGCGLVGGWLSGRACRTKSAEQSGLIVMGLLVGLAAGLGAIGFRWLIEHFRLFFFGGGQSVLSFMGPYYVILLPAAGGLLVGALTYWGAREARGHGVPEIMEAVALRGGAIRPRVAIVKSLASAICIGSGGSVGREGPIAQIGAALGSTLGQLLKLPDGRLRTLVAAGAAGGVAATFNAPLAGAFFALEVILVDWTAEAFAPIVVAAVSASVVGRMAFGNVPAFFVPQYSVSAFGQMPMFLVLGALAGVVGVAFTRLIYLAEDSFDRLPLPQWLLPVAGGLIMGVIGLFNHELYGVGYGAISAALTGTQYTLAVLVGLMVLKVLATSMTIGSGGSGGIFAPSLFIGSMLGASLGHVNQVLMPGSSVSPGAFALAGMGALFAATSHAPITATLIVFELTGDYRMILPLMLACGLGVITSRSLFRFSIYNLKLVRRGVHVTLAQDTRKLSEIPVSEAMSTDLISVKPEDSIASVRELFATSKHHGFPLLDDTGRLHGIVTIGDVHHVAPEHEHRPVRQVASHDLIVAFPNESLNEALLKLGMRDVGRLPVVDPEDHTRLLGLITRKNIIAAYNRRLQEAHTNLADMHEEEHFD
ncbi:MAG: chloride channel protein [Armatimonadetes bacterium]|nr:chloride channel protein [Armatimonadota bacterium]